jgi:hypothetical protein
LRNPYDNHRYAPKKHRDWVEHLYVGASVGALFVAVAAATIAGFAASFTYRQWQAAEKSIRISNRAYVNSTNFQFITYGGKVDEKNKWIISPIIENTGNTGTRRAIIHSGTVVQPNITTMWFDYNASNHEFSPYVIGPKSSDIGGIVSMMSNSLDQLDAVKGHVRLAAAGVIVYDDIFNEPHLSEFCYSAQFLYIDWERYPIGQPIRVRGLHCPEHNCEDEECGSDWRERITKLRQ